MTQAARISEALALYKKHGWALRRVLLTEKSRRELEDSLSELFGAAEIAGFEKDAAWFSRASGTDREAWELRLFGEAPFALVEVFGPEQDEKARAQARRAMEERLLEADTLKMEREA
jgi:hypothetical protein